VTSGQSDWYADELERQAALQAWKESKKAEREQQEREQKQSALQRPLQVRSQEWLDHTGATPSTSILSEWQREYVDQQARAREAEREAKIAALKREHYDRIQ
jgi:hypothetical protein